jgi:hypothetical protein
MARFGQGGYSSTDRFGRQFTRVGARDKKGNGYAKGYVEIKGKLYQIEVGPSQKEDVEYWLTVTEMPKNNNRGL